MTDTQKEWGKGRFRNQRQRQGMKNANIEKLIKRKTSSNQERLKKQSDRKTNKEKEKWI